MSKYEMLLPPDFDAQMDVALNNFDWGNEEGVKKFTLFMISTLYDQMADLAMSIAQPVYEAEQAKIKELADRFLTWPLPKSVCSDTCVSMSNYLFPRSGTNLLTAMEAEEMIRHVLFQDPEPRNVDGMTRAEFEQHLRVCYQHDNVRARERGDKSAPLNGLTPYQERDIAERVELNYPTAPKPDKTYATILMSAAAKSGDSGAIKLAAQFAGVESCPACGFVNYHCRCETKPT